MGCTILDCEQLKMLPVILNYVRIAKKKKKGDILWLLFSYWFAVSVRVSSYKRLW